MPAEFAAHLVNSLEDLRTSCSVSGSEIRSGVYRLKVNRGPSVVARDLPSRPARRIEGVRLRRASVRYKRCLDARAVWPNFNLGERLGGCSPATCNVGLRWA